MAAVNRRLLIEACFLLIMGVFRRRRRRERQRTCVRDLIWISVRLHSSSWSSCTCLYIPLKIWDKTIVSLYFLHKKCQVDCFLNVCVGIHLEKRERMQRLLVLLLSPRSLWSLESGFHTIATIATIAEIELKSISAIVVAAIAVIAEARFSFDRWTFFSANAVIVAIIWKPGLTYQCLEMLFVSSTCKFK